jgi:hypothetical protein
MNIMEDILSTYYKFTLSAISDKLNVSGHMLIWVFFLVLVCGTRAQICPHLQLHLVQSITLNPAFEINVISLFNLPPYYHVKFLIMVSHTN